MSSLIPEIPVLKVPFMSYWESSKDSVGGFLEQTIEAPAILHF